MTAVVVSSAAVFISRAACRGRRRRGMRAGAFASADPKLASDAEARLERLLGDARNLAALGAVDELAQLFREPLVWQEPQRGYQAVRRLCQVVLDSGADLGDQA